MGWKRCLLAGFVAGLGIPAARCQEDAGAEVKLPTLHVYMDLVQVPVLVLDGFKGTMKPVDGSRFRVSLDGGPEFKPRRVRLEGDDPIALGILLDVNGDQARMMPQMADALARLVPGSLHPGDRVSVYILNCTVSRTLKGAPAEPARLSAAVDRALDPWRAEQKEKHKPKCEQRVGLWDAIRLAVQDMAGLPGRQVLLAVTDGVEHAGDGHAGSDRAGSMDAEQRRDRTRAAAQAAGVAVFALAPAMPPAASFNLQRAANAFTYPAGSGLTQLTESTGGTVMQASRLDLTKQMARFAEVVRGRYILEFARPRNDTPGEHGIVVSIVKTYAFIKPAGVSIQIAERTAKDDIEGIAPDTSDAPVLGKAKAPK